MESSPHCDASPRQLATCRALACGQEWEMRRLTLCRIAAAFEHQNACSVQVLFC